MHACHGHRYRPLPVPLSGRGEKKGGGSKGGIACTGWYKEVRAVRPESVAGGGANVSATHSLYIITVKYVNTYNKITQ